MNGLSVQAVVDHVMDRLASGIYSPGSKLPTSRELAIEMGVHRNTAAKAYRSLADLGLITVRQGRGSFAAVKAQQENRQLRITQLSESVTDCIVRARRSGMPEDDLRRLFDERVKAVYQAPPAQGVFVECNSEDLTVAITEIEQLTGIRLKPLLLDEIEQAPAKVSADADVIFTSLFHITEVKELIARVGATTKVVSLYTQPDEHALDEIAQINPGSRVGIVVSNVEGGRRYVAQLNTFTSVSPQVLVRPSDEEIRKLAQTVDVIVYSRSRARQMERLALETRTIGLSFHISRDSAARVTEVLLDRSIH